MEHEGDNCNRTLNVDPHSLPKLTLDRICLNFQHCTKSNQVVDIKRNCFSVIVRDTISVRMTDLLQEKEMPVKDHCILRSSYFGVIVLDIPLLVCACPRISEPIRVEVFPIVILQKMEFAVSRRETYMVKYLNFSLSYKLRFEVMELGHKRMGQIKSGWLCKIDPLFTIIFAPE